MNLLKGRTALITGAARGIGKAIAMKFASEGANIAFSDLNYDENMIATEAELNALGIKAKGYASNASVFEDGEKLIEAVVNDFDRIDILVNNAGITRDNLLMRMQEKDWDMVIGVNLKSAFNLTKAVQRIMMKQKYGSIINMIWLNVKMRTGQNIVV
jgi:3-oxoacyl-[acyl-carrier protein] reductase